MCLRLFFSMEVKKRGVKHIGGQLIERKAMRGARLPSFLVQIFHVGIKQREEITRADA
jgi:hypothetical protein